MRTRLPTSLERQDQSGLGRRSSPPSVAQFDDARPEMAAQLRLQSLMANSLQAAQLRPVQMAMDDAKERSAQPEPSGVVNSGLTIQCYGRVVQFTLQEALHYYNSVTKEKATRLQDVDKSKLKPGQKSYFTRLHNQGAGKAAPGVRKVGSSSGAGRYRLTVPQQIRVRYGSSKARFARSERKNRHVKGKYSGYNYATAKVMLTNRTSGAKRTIYITRGSQDGSTHSEGAIKDVLKMLQGLHVVSVD